MGVAIAVIMEIRKIQVGASLAFPAEPASAALLLVELP
jgi:hypothetical protein